MSDPRTAELVALVARLLAEPGSARTTLLPDVAQAHARVVDGPPGRSAPEVLAWLADALANGHVPVGAPRYFGMPHAAPAPIAIAALALAAAANPELATLSHAPFPVLCEEDLVRSVGERLGYAKGAVEGTFTQGGAEANLTAVLVALARAFPESVAGGVRALPAAATIYASQEAHPTIVRAARVAGLGESAVRRIPVDDAARIRIDALRDRIGRDRAVGARPLLVVGTAGTTTTGSIDDLDALADVAARHGAAFHVDAAWGGLLAIAEARPDALAGLARADSITFDPHKALAVPLGCGLFLTRHRGALDATFGGGGSYMPRNAARDPYAHGLAWSRRFIGAPLAAVLAHEGWDGVRDRARRQLALGDHLRERLTRARFRVIGSTPLPVACFVDGARADGDRGAHLAALVRDVIARAGCWLTVVRLPGGQRVIRASVTSRETTEGDVDALVRGLEAARARDGAQ